MSVTFVHLSDIHFGQETGGAIVVHDDVKERLIEDVTCVAKTLENGRATGIIVTGDIAFGGRDDEYREAGDWLDKVADAAGCERHDIQVVPGNHDIDRAKITELTRLALAAIETGGDCTLDRILASNEDRELLFLRFSAYRPFAAGYRCPLNTDAALEERVAELAPGRAIRFVRMNSALTCSVDNEKGKLLLGARQRVLKPRQGEEIVVLCHHPVHWLQDSADALRFLRARARVFMSGHEHVPSLTIQNVDEGKDLMLLGAGAAVPPGSNDLFDYHYNFIEFDWDPVRDALSVGVRPRLWIDEEKKFSADAQLIANHGEGFVLECPYFRGAPRLDTVSPSTVEPIGASDTIQIAVADQGEGMGEQTVGDDYPFLLLRFFRDLSPGQRRRVLLSLGGIPDDWSEALNESFERKAFDLLVKIGRIDDLRNEIAKLAKDG